MPKEGQDNSFGVLSVTLGIVSLAIMITNNLPGLLLGVLGLIFAYKQDKIAKNKWSKAGKIVGFASIIIGIISTVVIIIYLSAHPESYPSMFGGVTP